MNFENPTQKAEKEPRWLSLDEILEKVSSFIDIEKYPSPLIRYRENGLVELVEYLIKNDDGTTSELGYRLKGKRSQNTTIDIGHFEGAPEDGVWLGGGGTLSDYDELSGEWTDVKGVK